MRYLRLSLSLLTLLLIGPLYSAGESLHEKEPASEEQHSFLERYAAAPGRPAWAPLEIVWGQRSLDAALLAGLSSESPEQRARAALALGLTGAEAHRDRLAAALTDPVAEVRRVAALALCYLGDACGEVEARLTLLQGEPWQRELALVGLWRLDSPATRNFLRAVAAEQPTVIGNLTLAALRSPPWRPAYALAGEPAASPTADREQAWESLADSLVLTSDYWWHLGEYDRVCHLLEAALFFSPQRVELYGDIAWLQWSLGRDDQAIAVLKRGVVANPGDWGAEFNLGFHYFNTRRYQEALPYLQAAAEHTPTWPVPIHIYAHALEALGRIQEALHAWDLALRRFPGDTPAQRNRERLQHVLEAPSP